MSGASGLIGRSLVPYLTGHGHDVLTLVRREPRGAHELRWDPTTGRLDPQTLGVVDAVVNLSGANVGEHRWTPQYKDLIVTSRTQTTTTLVNAALALDTPPTVLVNASAIGAYGEGGTTILTESSPRGDDFLSDVVARWEAATQPLAAAGVRVVLARTGLLANPTGGAFGRLLPLFRLGLGGRLGSGSQWWSLISMPDELAALEFLLENPLPGPVNLVCPQPAHNRDITRELAKALHRPALVPVPAPALKLALGEFSEQVLGSQRVVPTALTQAGFTFAHPDARAVVRWLANA
ncbi:MAG: TIGR01777 family oxidoreductase [Janthinobacterium lividum]